MQRISWRSTTYLMQLLCTHACICSVIFGQEFSYRNEKQVYELSRSKFATKAKESRHAAPVFSVPYHTTPVQAQILRHRCCSLDTSRPSRYRNFYKNLNLQAIVWTGFPKVDALFACRHRREMQKQKCQKNIQCRSFIKHLLWIAYTFLYSGW